MNCEIYTQSSTWPFKVPHMHMLLIYKFQRCVLCIQNSRAQVLSGALNSKGCAHRNKHNAHILFLHASC